MRTSLAEAQTPYLSVRKSGRGGLRLAALRHETGRFSLGKIGLALALALVALPVVLATIYYVFLASSVFTSESRFVVRSTVEASPLDLGSELSGKDGGKSIGGLSGGLGGGLGNLAGAADGLTGGSQAGMQDPFVVSSYMMSPEITNLLDRDGWLRRQFSSTTIDYWSRLDEHASQEELFAYWRRHVTAAVDRRSNTLQLRVRAYSPEIAQEIATRALGLAERMIAEITRRQREDTLALAKAEVVGAELRYEKSSLKLQQLRRTTRIVEPAQETKAAATTLLRLIYERIRARTELLTLERLAGNNAPGRAELLAAISALDAQIKEANGRLTGDSDGKSVLSAVASLEELELERRFAQGMLTVATNVFDRARREAEHRSSFLLVYLEPTRPVESREPNVWASIAFVAALAGIAWLFCVTAAAITLDQID